jgi:hypothetical protein
MILVRVNPHRSNSLFCCSCKNWKESKYTFADLEGVPFESYYCDDCVISDPEKLNSCRYSHNLAEIRAGEILATGPDVIKH